MEKEYSNKDEIMQDKTSENKGDTSGKVR